MSSGKLEGRRRCRMRRCPPGCTRHCTSCPMLLSRITWEDSLLDCMQSGQPRPLVQGILGLSSRLPLIRVRFVWWILVRACVAAWHTGMPCTWDRMTVCLRLLEVGVPVLCVPGIPDETSTALWLVRHVPSGSANEVAPFQGRSS